MITDIESLRKKATFLAFQTFMHEVKKQMWARFSMLIKQTQPTEPIEFIGQSPAVKRFFGSKEKANLTKSEYLITAVEWYMRLTFSARSLYAKDFKAFFMGPNGRAVKNMGITFASHPNLLLFELLENGEVGIGYDGAPFFSNNHPYTKSDDTDGVNSNLITGGGVASAAAITLDFEKLTEAVLNIETRDDQNFFTDMSQLPKPTIVAPTGEVIQKNMREAFLTATTPAGGANPYFGAVKEVIHTAKLSGASWYPVYETMALKPFIFGVLLDKITQTADDRAKENEISFIMDADYDMHYGEWVTSYKIKN
jgi:phage major head subunit gpT-like protein